METRRSQPLLPSGPVLRVLEDLLCAWLYCVGHRRPEHAARLTAPGLGLAQVAPDRVSFDAHLARELAEGDALDKVPVAYDVNLFHGEHPPSECLGPDGLQATGGGSVLERRESQF